MERSQSYNSFETTGTMRQNQLTNKLNNCHFHHSASSSNLNSYFNDKFASTSSLNLRKALELRQTQLQSQQQEQLQRQQWQLLFEQRRQQQQELAERLKHAASIDQIDSPLYHHNTFNNLQLMQAQRQKIFQQQKSSITTTKTTTKTATASSMSHDNLVLAFQHDNDNDDDDADDDDGDDEDVDDDEHYGVVLREHAVIDDDPINLVCVNKGNNEINQNQMGSGIPLKLQRFQRQRPYSETAINFPTAPLSPTFASNPTTTETTTTTTTTTTMNIVNSDRHRLQSLDQSLSFDSAIGTTSHNSSSISGSNSSTTSSNTNNNSNINININKPNSSNNNNNNMSPLSPRHPHFGKLKRDNSLHSDSSRYSSVDSLLEARKPDPEAILINLGFGPIVSEDILSRIPKRFLKPSQVRGIDTDAFIKRLQLANSLADHSVLGYRGLIGNPDLPPSTIVAKIMERFEVNERKKSMGSIEQTMR